MNTYHCFLLEILEIDSLDLGRGCFLKAKVVVSLSEKKYLPRNSVSLKFCVVSGLAAKLACLSFLYLAIGLVPRKTITLSAFAEPCVP